MSILCFLGIIIALIHASNCVSPDSLTNYEKLYELGLDAYRQEKYPNCINFIKNALEDYKFYTTGVIDCRLKCKDAVSHTTIESFFHANLQSANCLRRCKKQKFGDRREDDISLDTNRKFEDRAPYNYLQFCYFKNGDYKEAAGATYTYYITHQDDKRTLANLKYYKDMQDVVEADFEDLERKPYQKAYVKGLLAYNAGTWEAAIDGFEEALTLYFTEEERCRAGCEGGFTHNGFPDFVNAIADHYIAVIVCKQKCLQKLATFGMEELEHFVAEHYNYLQYAYYQSNQVAKAVQCTANFLVFEPTDPSMIDNKFYYVKTLRRKEEEFSPSQTILDYVSLWKAIDSSLDFVREQYILPYDTLADTEGGEEEETETEKHYMHKFTKLGIKLHAESKELKGDMRFAADDLIRRDQCVTLADLAKSKPTYSKDGIKQITIPEAMELVQDHPDYEISLRLLLRAADMIKAYTMTYFNMSQLVVMDTKVICRSGGDKLGAECVPQEDGTCMGAAGPPGDTGDISAVAYLTDITDGTGQLYFMDDDKEVQSYLSPKCGRFVGFGNSNKHGVNLSWKVERCAIVVELSQDKTQQSTDVQEAASFLTELDEKRSEDEVDNTEVLKQFYDKGVTITATGTDLMSDNSLRLVADGLSTQQQCDQLIQLAKSEGISGDGYAGKVSPHTDRELYSGLEILHANKKGVIKGDGYEDEKSDNDPTTSLYVSPYTIHEIFEGLNVTWSLELVKQETISVQSLQQYLDISDSGRVLTEKYFNLTRPLYFDYTHLVCRTAIEQVGDTSRGDLDLSHPVHADNCMIQPDGSCKKHPKAFEQRHYSAILYLNEDFEGGEFFFAHKNKSEQVTVKPKCGRLVSFNSGEYHGVKAVLKGQRCAIAMWYTHDPNHVEVSRLHAQRQLDTMNSHSEHVTKDSDQSQESVTDKMTSQSPPVTKNSDQSQESVYTDKISASEPSEESLATNNDHRDEL